jgi:glycosyltransferase involved in cell wall biosynthesis
VALISILILTKNEQKDLPSCLASVPWCDDVHILDSGSTDDTCEIARRCGASVVTRTYSDNNRIFGGDEAAHRNWGLRNIRFKHPWILLLDADEEVTEELASAIEDAVASPGANVAFRIQRRDFLNKTWLKHVQTSPFYMRLVRPEKVRYERLINPLTIADGPVGSVRGFLNHYPFSKGLSHWLDRHNSYSTLEARQIMENRRNHVRFSVRKAFTARDFSERRYHQKELFYRIPCRPVFKLLLLYVGKRGFLDGRAGLQYALLQAIYEYMIVLKVQELQRSGS